MLEKGIVGVSGDLVLLLYFVLGMMGEGKMWSLKSGWVDVKYVCYIKENIYVNIKISFIVFRMFVINIIMLKL